MAKASAGDKCLPCICERAHNGCFAWCASLYCAVVVNFRNVGAAPALRQSKFKIDAEQRFNAVITFLRKQLQCAETDSLVRRAVAIPCGALHGRAARECSRRPCLCCALASISVLLQFVYVNSAFAPSPEELIADVARCFHTDGVLNLNYCTTPAWG